MYVILVGPPGSGKGTQADFIKEKYHMYHLSTGNLIREEIAKQSAIGKRAKKILDQGKYLDDKTMLQMVHQVIQKHKNILFDGFPRTLAQAKALSKMIDVDIVLQIQVEDKEVIRRLSSRWMVKKNHKEHTFLSKKEAQEYVTYNGGELFHRDDDTPKLIKERLKTHHSLTDPLVAYYGKLHKIYLVHGEKSIPNVWKDIQKILAKCRK